MLLLLCLLLLLLSLTTILLTFRRGGHRQTLFTGTTLLLLLVLLLLLLDSQLPQVRLLARSWMRVAATVADRPVATLTPPVSGALATIGLLAFIALVHAGTHGLAPLAHQIAGLDDIV